MNMTLENLDNVIRAMAVADVYCALEDVPAIAEAIRESGIRHNLAITPHPSIHPGTVQVLPHRPGAA